ncbi:Testis-expressed sequence 2 protein [Madurella mycetomatis]|uniref:Testis-expressed sequence 2 protein n=1 Tax=Madurella mycetomatis TaxID=100816 RepID=A0A175VXI3_9PEZI|nr:Testis-expressed sequence 2 protein [Madurella mycetomatis]
MGWTTFLLTYLLGGITFLPLLAVAILIHAHLTFPYREDADVPQPSANGDDLIQPGDDLDALKAAQKEDAKARQLRHESDVAAGYFAVCREYTPMGINAKPIERSTPVGSAMVAAPSQSVYQTMYRSIFDRKAGPSPLDNKNGVNQRPKKAGNVFYVVLRHGHLMLFDDDEQLEVRHVVSLAHHDISVYSGEAVTPEGELWIKRNAICLSRRADGPELGPDSQLSKPFYLFSENCSAKEDFYFALLRNQEQTFSAENKVPTPLQFDVKNIISLVQKIHSSEEQMQTRWLNALIGRLFLGIYKTKDIENFIRAKLTKKISRVKRPTFLSNIAIKAIDTGESAPNITNPRLKDLTVEGECGVEADLRYTGNFRLEVAATVRIDLGSRFKPREVNLVLAVVVRKLEGHALFKIKPPPSNRIWFSFQQAPKIEMTIEPIVSSRQITYTVILRQIENRIKEVIAETIVLPFWDDTPFFSTEHKIWRGGIFHDDTVKPSTDLESAAAQEGDLSEVERLEGSHGVQESDLPAMEKSHSTPVLENKPSVGLFGRKISNKKSKTDLLSSPSASPSTSLTNIEANNESEPRSEVKTEASSPPPVLSASIAQPSSPIVGTVSTNADQFKPSSSPPNGSPAMSVMATLSAKSHSPPPAQTPSLNAFRPYVTSKSSKAPSYSSVSSQEATDMENGTNKTPQARRNTASSTESHSDSGPPSPSRSTKDSVRTQAGPVARGLFGRRETASSVSSALGSSGANESQKRTALAAVTNAAASAKRWGLNAFQRRANDGAATNHGQPSNSASSLDLTQPMGRGQPLPPPGTPLPMPDKKATTAPIQVPKRKPIPPPSTERQNETASQNTDHRPVPPPPLPKRRHHHGDQVGDNDNMLVVAAPADSEPTTPLSASHSPSYVQPWVEDIENSDDVALSTGTENTVPIITGSEVSSLTTATERSPQDTVIGSPDLAEGDEDEYSAWMENVEPEEAEAAETSVV